MRFLIVIVQFTILALLLSCDQRHSAPEVDPMLGVECFESHRASLPPGTQYEGIETLAVDGLIIRIMNGVEVVTLNCELNADGTLQHSGQ